MEALSHNRVLPSLMLVALPAWLGTDLVSVAANRIVPGEGVRAVEALGWGGALVGAAALLALAVSG